MRRIGDGLLAVGLRLPVNREGIRLRLWVFCIFFFNCDFLNTRIREFTGVYLAAVQGNCFVYILWND